MENRVYDHHEITMLAIAEAETFVDCIAKIRRGALYGLALDKANHHAIVLMRENGGDDKFPEIRLPQTR